MALPRTSWRRRPLLVLIILILLLVVGYAARAFDGDARTSSQPASWLPTGIASQLPGSQLPGSQLTGPRLIGIERPMTQPAQDGGRLAAKAAMPSCACGLAK